MKFLNFFKKYNYKLEVSAICREYGIQNWSINDDGSVDVDGDVFLVGKRLEKIPLKFGKVSVVFSSLGGEFICLDNPLYEV